MAITTKDLVIRAEGSKHFINVYSSNIQKELGKRLVNTQISNNRLDSLTTAEWRISVLIFEDENFALVRTMLKALKMTLATERLALEIDSKLQVGQVVFKLDKELSTAIFEGKEITYLITYRVNQKLKKKSKAAIENIVGYFFDTCETDAEDFGLYIDRFHIASLEMPIPDDKISSVIKGTAHILEQISSIDKVCCIIKKTYLDCN